MGTTGISAHLAKQRGKSATPQTPSIQSLDRGLLILEAVAKSADPVGLGHLTDVLGIDRSSAFRLANTLRRRGFLANPNGRKDYVLGPSIWRLSRKHDWSNVLITFSHEHLKRLAMRTGETTHLALREGRQTFFIDHCHSSSQILVISGQTGEFAPLYCTAHGKALLLDCGLAELKSIFGTGPLQAYTSRTIVSLKQLVKDFARSRQSGFVVDDEEYVDAVRCLAAPVRDKDGLIIASIGISAPVSRFPPERDAVAARQVCEIAKELSVIFSAEDGG
ncbi:MAG TPA: IclR family transcriptional regulator [Bryobacteraceae bacterium]|nr:IclR family transcriptional regulator [Bryobacteraceae bacterium]